MLPYRRTAGLVSLAVFLTSLTACANMPTGKNIEQMLAADPRLKDNSLTFGSSNDPNRLQDTSATLPVDFPKVIPLYPNAQLQEVTQANGQNAAKSTAQALADPPALTRWVSFDPLNEVQNFYLNSFRENKWEILSQSTDDQGGTIEARLNDLQVSVSLRSASSTSTPSATPSPNQTPAGQNAPITTEFDIQYVRNTTETAPTNSDAQAQPNTNTQAAVPESGAPDFIGPVQPVQPTQPAATPNDPTTSAAAPGSEVFSDLSNVPQELRQYIEDLVALGALPLEQSGPKSNQSDTPTQFDPNKTISRREFARWLVAANNQIYANRPSLQIRGASPTAQRAFQDLPPQDPDFPVIQGLAEAGLIPSPLSGDSTGVLFRPDAPLTREQMILWKVPLDSRQTLPNASLDAVNQTWGFQDAARIEPKALRAVLADFQNGEQSNIRRVFGFTTLFQPKKAVTRAEAAAALWYFGSSTEGLSAYDALKREQGAGSGEQGAGNRKQGVGAKEQGAGQTP